MWHKKTRKKPLILREMCIYLYRNSIGGQSVFSDCWGGFCFRESELFLQFQWQRESDRRLVRQDVVHDGGLICPAVVTLPLTLILLPSWGLLLSSSTFSFSYIFTHHNVSAIKNCSRNRFHHFILQYFNHYNWLEFVSLNYILLNWCEVRQSF